MHIFYTPYIQLPVFSLDEQESKHAVKVLRLQSGDVVQLIDGNGGLYLAEIQHAHPRHCELKVKQTLQKHTAKPYHFHLAVAPTKHMDRFEFFVEKATEMGIDEITPLLCEHSERKVVKIERLNKVVISAAKQSVKPLLPRVNELTSFTELLQRKVEGFRFIAHCSEDAAKRSLKEIYEPAKNALILIGPEGDFSESEIEAAITAGFQSISLGKERLRTETAALAACHSINFINE